VNLFKLNLVVVGVVLALTAGFAFGLLLPGWKKLNVVQHDLALKLAAVEADQQKTGNVSDLYASILRINEQMSDFRKRLPQDRQFGDFLNELSEHLKGTDIQQYNVQPKAARPVDEAKLPKDLQLAKGVVVLPVSLSFETDFLRLFDFLKNLHTLGRVFHVESLSATGTETRPGEVRVEMVLQTYHRPD
jgi:Tfp pilus assembly protein PilO